MSSLRTISPNELEGSEPLSFGTREYFRARLRNRLYNFIVSKYMAREKAGEITQAALAKRTRRRPDVINRYLAAPGNWTLDTVSDLLLGIGPEELDMSASPVIQRPKRNENAHSGLYDYLEKTGAKPQTNNPVRVWPNEPTPSAERTSASQ
jgi:hypothetical protein